MNYCLNCQKATNNKKFCTNKCQKDYEYKVYIDNWKKRKY